MISGALLAMFALQCVALRAVLVRASWLIKLDTSTLGLPLKAFSAIDNFDHRKTYDRTKQ
jgi:hypothetical protein